MKEEKKASVASGLQLAQIKEACPSTNVRVCLEACLWPQPLSPVKVDHGLCRSQTAVFVLLKSPPKAETFHKIV